MFHVFWFFHSGSSCSCGFRPEHVSYMVLTNSNNHASGGHLSIQSYFAWQLYSDLSLEVALQPEASASDIPMDFFMHDGRSRRDQNLVQSHSTTHPRGSICFPKMHCECPSWPRRFTPPKITRALLLLHISITRSLLL